MSPPRHRTALAVTLLVSVASSTARAQRSPASPEGTSLDAAPADPAATATAAAQTRAPESPLELNPPSRFWALRASAELGVLGVLSHTIQLSRNGSVFDYVREGGQDNVSLFARVSAELELARRHHLVFLYQPLDLRTQVRVARDLLMNNVPFARGSALDLRYGFDFYRFSYAYDVLPAPNAELSFGATIQLRNAVITFTSADGVNRTLNNNVGIVPALKVRGRYTFISGAFVGFEADGSYASIPGLNGSDIPVEGALLDASLRAGLRLWGPAEFFVNVRYLGGGSRGVRRDPAPPGDGYVDNWLHTMALSLGANLR